MYKSYLTFIFTFRYEKELMHPLQNLIGGELPRALLIQVPLQICCAAVNIRISHYSPIVPYYFRFRSSNLMLRRKWCIFHFTSLSETWFHSNWLWMTFLLARAMLELDQILKANEINFAILAALPAFFLSVLLVMVVRAWLRKVRKVFLMHVPVLFLFLCACPWRSWLLIC